MKKSILLAVAVAAVGVTQAQNSLARFLGNPGSNLTSNVVGDVFRITYDPNQTLKYIDFLPNASNDFMMIRTGSKRIYTSQPLFINNTSTSQNGAVLSSYNGLPLVFGIGDNVTNDPLGTDYFTPRLSITAQGENVYGEVRGTRWRVDPRLTNSGDNFSIGYDDAAGTFTDYFTIKRDAGGIAHMMAGVNYTSTQIGSGPRSTFNIISRPDASAPNLASALTLKFGEAGTGPNIFGEWDIEMLKDAQNQYKNNLTFTSRNNANQGATTVMALFNNGNVSIAERLTCKEVLVTANVPWPDYVFKADYKLRDLKEVEQFIETNKHLPDVPSEAEIAEQGGAKIGEMNTVLLRKVEELTLYSIEQQKQIAELQKQIESMKSGK